MLENIPALAPSAFFTIGKEILYTEDQLPISKKELKPYILPDMSFLFDEDKFADVAMGWSEKGLFFDILVDTAASESFFPNYRDGDCVEIFIDTRDLKNAGFATRFCHHFIFFPLPVQGIVAQEMSRFRTDDMHELCDPKDLICHSDILSSSYRMRIAIPADCLTGYDPVAFNRIGFTYMISRSQEPSQHFVVSSYDYVIEQHPSLWSSCLLKSKNERK